MRAVASALIVLAVIGPQRLAADDKDKLVGTWKLVSWILEDDATKEQKKLYGEHPRGYATFTPGGRAFFVMTGEGRTAPKNDQESAAAFRSMLAYSGKYRLDGDKFITRVDAAWNEAWVGTDQSRTYKIEGNLLHIVSMSQPNVNFGNRMMHGIVTFERDGN